MTNTFATVSDVFAHFINTVTSQGYTPIYDSYQQDNDADCRDIVLSRDVNGIAYTVRLRIVPSENNNGDFVFYRTTVGFDYCDISTLADMHPSRIVLDDGEFTPCPTLTDVAAVVKCGLFVITNFNPKSDSARIQEVHA